jgi:hypothetical protein
MAEPASAAETVSAAEVWMVLAAAFGAAILTAIGTRWIAGFQAKKEAEREQMADLRHLRDEKRERLRNDYVILVQAALAMKAVAQEMLFLSGTKELREAWIDGFDNKLGSSKEDLDRAAIRLTLETGTEDVQYAYSEIQGVFRAYGSALLHEERAAGGELAPRSSDLLRQLSDLIDSMVAQSKAHLEALSQSELPDELRPL